MELPEPLYQHLKTATGLSITSVEPVSGGSINQAARLMTSGGDLFLKWNRSAPADMFQKEKQGLDLLREAHTSILIPDVLSMNSQESEIPGYLLMTWHEPHRGTREASRNFGQQLAKLHQHHSSTFGLDHDNYIGRLPQSNRQNPSWVEFFIQERIEPQLRKAIDSGLLKNSDLTHWYRLAKELPSLFPEAEPSLLHGDLWGGNYFFTDDRQVVLIDPAVYYGHPEMELSFTKMFGGFSDKFYDSYAGAISMESGFSRRVPVYNFYPLLVHVNLFGGHYAVQARSFLKNF